jgi:hypothetical protein
MQSMDDAHARGASGAASPPAFPLSLSLSLSLSFSLSLPLCHSATRTEASGCVAPIHRAIDASLVLDASSRIVPRRAGSTAGRGEMANAG